MATIDRALEKEREITFGDVASLLSYDPETGTFVRLGRRRRPSSNGAVGALSRFGYLEIRLLISGKSTKFRAHRLAWLLANGSWPKQTIDHINGNRSDNRFANLREATIAENNCNRPVASHSLTGVKGVTWDKSRGLWMARLNRGGKFINLGRFKDVESAKAAYAFAAVAAHKDFARPA